MLFNSPLNHGKDCDHGARHWVLKKLDDNHKYYCDCREVIKQQLTQDKPLEIS